jgi:hypothetical protein
VLLALLPSCASYFPVNDRMDDWPEAVGFHLVELDFTRHPDTAEQRYLNRLPTSFHLEAEAVDRLQRAGRTILRDSPAYEAFLEDLDR